ncbi:hypothetical protein X875_3420 [Mannheimia varigena USDA-ARS-USMARC-1388]|nr:hypothetical protein X875_3420 [Mannheimia varigena USDA-ARS-USMARC-1388]
MWGDKRLDLGRVLQKITQNRPLVKYQIIAAVSDGCLNR